MNNEVQAVVRRYLRAVTGNEAHPSDSPESCEPAFVAVASSWAEDAGVDRRTLLALGVPRSVLDRAGLQQEKVATTVRRFYATSPFTVADVARRSTLSVAAVRRVVLLDQASGLIEHIEGPGRASWYQAVDA